MALGMEKDMEEAMGKAVERAGVQSLVQARQETVSARNVVIRWLIRRASVASTRLAQIVASD